MENYVEALQKLGASTELRALSEDFDLKENLKDAADFERVVVAGGDGTVSAIASFLQGSGIPLIAYPAGTANLLALNLKMPGTAEELADVTLNGAVFPTDLGRLDYRVYRRRDYFRARFGFKSSRPFTSVHFAIMAGSGFPARLVSQAQPLKGTFGKAAYWLSAFFSRRPRIARLKLKIDGRRMRRRGIGVIIVNFEKIQFDLKMAPDSDARDGKFEVIILKAKSLWGLFPVVWGLIQERLGLKRPDHPREVEIVQGSEIEISSWPPLRLQFDGETLPKTSFFKVKVLPAAVHFVYGK